MIKPILSKILKGSKNLEVFNVIRKGADKKIGQAPGTITYVGEKKVEDVTISVIDYDTSSCSEKQVVAVEDCFPFKGTQTVPWINVNGLHDT
jgi:magnesium transporter